MAKNEHGALASALLKQAIAFGADLAGFASVEDLKRAPSFMAAPETFPVGKWVGVGKRTLGLKPGEVRWPDGARTVLVVAVHHPENRLEMDWWQGPKDPPGNRILARVVRDLCRWAQENFGIGVFHLPYHVEEGGLYLKDAAVLAGLGCIGRNNMLVTPEFGPRVRLRALTIDIELPSSGQRDFDPCRGCENWCRKACPQSAFDSEAFDEDQASWKMRPGRDGCYSRAACNRQMEADVDASGEAAGEGYDDSSRIIRFCRCCEFSCPVGRTFHQRD